MGTHRIGRSLLFVACTNPDCTTPVEGQEFYARRKQCKACIVKKNVKNQQANPGAARVRRARHRSAHRDDMNAAERERKRRKGVATKLRSEMTPAEIESRRAAGRKNAAKKYVAMRKIVDAARDVPCGDCERDDLPPEIKHLHHVRGEKLFTITQKLLSKSEQQIRDEIAKCVVLCPTCHALRHYETRQAGGCRYGSPRKEVGVA